MYTIVMCVLVGVVMFAVGAAMGVTAGAQAGQQRRGRGDAADE